MKKLLSMSLIAACISGSAYAKELKIVQETAAEPAEAVIISGVTAVEVPASEITRKNSGKLFYKAENYHEMAALPGYSMGAPSGLVSSWGVIFAGITGQTNSDTTDGSLAMGMGLGDPNRSLGGSASLSIGSVDPRDGGSFNRGSLNLAAGHHFQKYKLGVSAGVSGIDLWHDKGADNLDPSFYGAVTKLLPNDTAPVVLSLGLGNNMYADISSSGDLKDKVFGFASAAVYVMPQLSLIADYTSNMLSFGAGIVPFPDYPVSLTLGIKDVTEQADDKPYFIGTLAAAYVF